MRQKFLSIAIFNAIILFISASFVTGLVNFKYDPIIISKHELDIIQSITQNELLEFTKRGIESNNQEKSLESNLVGANIIVKNGSISHVQLLDTLPNPEAQTDSEVADQILKSSLYIYSSKCAPKGISGKHCEYMLSDRELPRNIELFQECQDILKGRRNGHYPFRRLLPRHYKDGFYKMFSNVLPEPLAISCALGGNSVEHKKDFLDDSQRNLAVVQWAMFVADDLSKPVVTVMSNGSPIECCNIQNYKLQPRQQHPACASLISKDITNRYGRVNCLHYVRSALAVGNKCTFAAPEQANQASAELDLSQLYGFTDNAQQRMRLYKNGHLKSADVEKLEDSLLPLISKDSHMFCALSPGNEVNATCFMAGDTRVNRNPFAIVLYTIMMRNHNRLANALKVKYPNWLDEQLFQTAKSINIDIYHKIVFNEWLPVILGTTMFNEIKKQIKGGGSTNNYQISNEYAVAASRFYLSMMPNELHNYAMEMENNPNTTDSNIFTLKDEIYTSSIGYTSKKISDILYSLLRQRAMKMDTSYVDSLIADFMNNKRPTHMDMLAFDIQRGRDHGLQSYVKYLEICNNVEINDWKDLERFILPEDLNKLKRIYMSWRDIDLIVGGISEISSMDVAVGPTFQCIIAEQFSKLRQWHQKEIDQYNEISMDITKWKSMTAADLLCFNSNLKEVPSNIFQISSNTNPMLSCTDRLNKFYSR